MQDTARGRSKMKDLAKRRHNVTKSIAAKYNDFGPCYCRTDMYAGCMACCPLMSQGEYANKADRQTDRVSLTLGIFCHKIAVTVRRVVWGRIPLPIWQESLRYRCKKYGLLILTVNWNLVKWNIYDNILITHEINSTHAFSCLYCIIISQLHARSLEKIFCLVVKFPQKYAWK